MTDSHDIRLTVNGRQISLTVDSRTHLADAIRHGACLTGTHVGCEHGVCGACTVLVDGASARSCLMFAVQAAGKRVDTVEGLAHGDQLNDFQAALSRHGGLQCGFCTPGVLMTLTELRAELGDEVPSEAQVRAALSGNLCRCTGYQGIVDAALEVLGRRKEKGSDGTA